MKIFSRKLMYGAWYFFTTLLILAAILVAFAHLLTPLLNKHRPDFENWASTLLQVPIRIQEVHADWRANIPELTFSQVVVLDKNTRQPAFEIQEVKFGFQLFSSLWQRKVVLQDIIISGADVTVLQTAAGGYTIKDLPDERGLHYPAYELSNILGWIFSQPYLSLRDIQVHILLSQGEKHVLDIQKVALVNQGEQHKMKGNFSLLQEVPVEMIARVEWFGRPNDPAHIKAKAYLDVEGLSLGQWLQGKNRSLYGLLSGWQVYQGMGGLGVWLDWEESQLQQAQFVFQWYDLEFYSELDKKIYSLDRLSGHIGWKREGDKAIFAGDNILVNFPNHLWPATTFYLSFVPDHEKIPVMAAPVSLKQSLKAAHGAVNPYAAKLKEGLDYAEAGVKKAFVSEKAWRLAELRIGYLNLQDLLPLVLANSSLPSDWRKNLKALEPVGELQNLDFSCRGDWTDLSKITLSGEGRELTFNALQAWPGLANFSGSLQWDRGEGLFHVASQKLSITLPALFAEPLFLEKAAAKIDLQYSKDRGWFFKAKQLDFSNANAELSAKGALTFPPQASPILNLEADYSLAKITQLSHYLPAKIMDPALVAWLKGAFLEGRIEAGKLRIQGSLDQFPFDPDEMKEGERGQFEASGELQDVDFHYAPQWPLLQEADGRLVFSGRSMTATIDSAAILDVPVKEVFGVIPYLGVAKPQIVNIKAKLETDLADGLDFIHQSPLEKGFGKELAALQLKGSMKLNLFLSIPLAKPEQVKLAGKAEVNQGVLELPDWNVSMSQVNGAFEFTEQNLSAKQLQGVLWKEPAFLHLSTVLASKGKPAYVKAELRGKVDIDNLQEALKFSLTQFLSGSAAFEAQLKLYQSAAANTEVALFSNLQGVAVDLPAPFNKKSMEKRDFALQFVVQQAPGFKTQLRYGDLVRAQLNIRQEQNTRVLDIDSSPLKGTIRLAYPFNAKRPIEANLERLVVSTGNAQTISTLDPQTLPPLLINSQQFIYGNRNLGQLNLSTTPRPNGMTIQNFSLSAADYRFQSKGQWTGSGQAQQSQLQGTIESSKVNRFLDRLGLSLRSLLVDKGRAAFDLHWKGAPYSVSLATLSGDFSFALEKGRIINLNESDNTKMDMGRMLSLFSLQTIPRRLSLDFSDLFEKGYSFDFMRGDFSLKQGSAFTQKPAVFEGPVAHVAASGRIGLLAQDYDLSLSISPYLTDSLPVVAGALTLNPLVGAAAWVVNKVVLSKEVSRVITYNYKVTGSWHAPVWRSVQGTKR